MIQIEWIAGDTDIETLVQQVYLQSQLHFGVRNSTARLSITMLFPEKASSTATKGHLVQTGTFDPIWSSSELCVRVLIERNVKAVIAAR